MSYVAEVALVLAVVAAACAVPGVFLLLRRTAMVSDAVGHVLLFGVMAAYLVVRDAGSPWLLAGAAASGLLAVCLVEALGRTRRVKEDAALGLVFSALFALGVLLASLYARDAHLDVDRVLLGVPELATVPRWRAFGVAVPPVAVTAAALAANVALAAAFFKELKLTTFDPGLAAALGFRPGLMHYGLMAVVSATAVAAFDAVGPVLVVGFFVVPAAAAYLLTDRLGVLLVLAAGIGAGGAAAGAVLAFELDIRYRVPTSVTGTVTTVLGLTFAAVFLLAPGRGVVARAVRRRRQRRAFHEAMLAVHLLHHEGTPAEADEARAATVHEHLAWAPGAAAAVVARAGRNGLVVRDGDRLRLTPAGRARARAVLGLGPDPGGPGG